MALISYPLAQCLLWDARGLYLKVLYLKTIKLTSIFSLCTGPPCSTWDALDVINNVKQLRAGEGARIFWVFLLIF